MRTVIFETRDGWRKRIDILDIPEEEERSVRTVTCSHTGAEWHSKDKIHLDLMRDIHYHCKDFEPSGDIEQDGNDGIEVWRER